MADAVLVPNPNGGMGLLAFPVTVTNSDGNTVTGLAFANIIVTVDGTPVAAGSTDFSVAGNPLPGAVQ